jgi:hypothetical protein
MSVPTSGLLCAGSTSFSQTSGVPHRCAAVLTPGELAKKLTHSCSGLVRLRQPASVARRLGERTPLDGARTVLHVEEEDIISTIEVSSETHPLLTYFALTFAIRSDGKLRDDGWLIRRRGGLGGLVSAGGERKQAERLRG